MQGSRASSQVAGNWLGSSVRRYTRFHGALTVLLNLPNLLNITPNWNKLFDCSKRRVAPKGISAFTARAGDRAFLALASGPEVCHVHCAVVVALTRTDPYTDLIEVLAEDIGPMF